MLPHITSIDAHKRFEHGRALRMVRCALSAFVAVWLGMLLKSVRCSMGVLKMKTPPNNKVLESAPDKANYTSKINLAAAVLNRITAVVHPDLALLVVLLCLLLWGAL